MAELENELDYSNTIIYKIYCNDKNINDVYVGHTTNFTKRKHQHKLCSSNLNNTLKIYKKYFKITKHQKVHQKHTKNTLKIH